METGFSFSTPVIHFPYSLPDSTTGVICSQGVDSEATNASYRCSLCLQDGKLCTFNIEGLVTELHS